MQRGKKKSRNKLGELHPPLHAYMQFPTFTPCSKQSQEKINAKFTKYLKKISLFLKSTILHCGLWCSCSLSHLKSSQSVFLSSSTSTHLLSTKVQTTPLPFAPAGLALFQNASTGKQLGAICHYLLGISKPKMHYKNIAI